MAELAQLRAFAEAVRLGSLAAAGRSLGLSRSQTGKLVAALEQSLGVQLLVRTSRSLTVTDAGRDYHESVVDVLARLAEADAVISSRQHQPQGSLRINAPMSFGVHRLARLLPAFMERFPRISVDLHLDDRLIDPVEGGYDVTVRIAALADSDLVARRLCDIPRLLCASPGYVALHGAPSSPQDLREHACLHYGYLASGSDWRLESQGGRAESVAVRGPVCSNNAEALLEIARGGAGVALLPRFLAERAIAAGELTELLPDWHAPMISACALSVKQRSLPAATRVFVDFLVERLSASRPGDARPLRPP
jgi:DNA-binding transcriptional LysR family regulator